MTAPQPAAPAARAAAQAIAEEFFRGCSLPDAACCRNRTREMTPVLTDRIAAALHAEAERRARLERHALMLIQHLHWHLHREPGAQEHDAAWKDCEHVACTESLTFLAEFDAALGDGRTG